MSKTSEISSFLNLIILLGSVGGVFVFYDDIRSAIVTKDFLQTDQTKQEEIILEAFDSKLAPVIKSAEFAESNTLPNRIQNLLKLKCATPRNFTDSLQTLLERLKARYQELNHREYGEGSCEHGMYYNSLGVLVP